jgi:hypothetical protein
MVQERQINAWMVVYRQSHQMARLQLSMNTPCLVCVMLLIPIDIWHPLPTQSRVCPYFFKAHIVTSTKKSSSHITSYSQSGVHKLSNDLSATSKFFTPKWWHGATFITLPTLMCCVRTVKTQLLYFMLFTYLLVFATCFGLYSANIRLSVFIYQYFTVKHSTPGQLLVLLSLYNRGYMFRHSAIFRPS